MLILDTDHFSELVGSRSLAAKMLLDRLEKSEEEIAITIVTVEELLRGWLASIHQTPSPRDQIRPYQRLEKLMQVTSEWITVPWDDLAVDTFDRLRPLHRRLGTMDLKIASIAISRQATLLSRNLVDFNPIVELHSEDWLSNPSG